LLPVDLPATAMGGPIAISATGPGDAGPPASRDAIVLGRGVRPPRPIALDAQRLADGTIRVSWIRRSRSGWAWLDGADAPLGEESERYRLSLASDGIERVVEIPAGLFDYPSGEQPAALLSGGHALTVSVAQLGRLGPSLPPETQTFLV
jgi:hypothetical protein